MDRRKFIRQGCLACFGIGAGISGLSSCAGMHTVVKPTLQGRDLKVPLAEMPPNGLLVLRHPALEADLLLVKENEQYHALLMTCTHNRFPLNLAGKKLVCQSHGSEFDLNGEVTHEPATRALRKYPVELREQALWIAIDEI